MSTFTQDGYKLRSRTIYKSSDIRRPKTIRRGRSEGGRKTKRCGKADGGRKTAGSKKLAEIIKKLKGASNSQKRKIGYEEQCRDCAVPALAYYNHFMAPGDGGVTYTMVGFGWSIGFISRSSHGIKYHCNFTVRPHYSNGPPMLFFAEVVKKYNQDDRTVLQCKRLGPQGSDPLHHPLDGDFDEFGQQRSLV